MAKTYYIDWINGDNTNDGLSESTPKQFHDDIELLPGDTVLFKRGNMLRDWLKATNGSEEGIITYGSYGEGPKPIFCGSSDVTENTEIASTEADIAVTPEETEAPHEHSFTETITKEATCLEAGEKTLACECGESSVEEVPATGHDFSNYVSNEDATYTADGTETATCTCGETDTRVAEGSMLTYTFEDMDATKYAKSTVNVRSLPTSDGEKLGGLSTNDEVKVTGKCNETGWYRIEYSDGIAYVSNDYLVDAKVEVAKASAPATSSLPTYATYAEVKAYAISLGYPIGSATDNGDGSYTGYYIGVSDGVHTSFDFEWGNGRCDDYTNSYWSGDAIIGRTGSPSNYKWTKIAHTTDTNWNWEVVTYIGK